MLQDTRIFFQRGGHEVIKCHHAFPRNFVWLRSQDDETKRFQAMCNLYGPIGKLAYVEASVIGGRVAIRHGRSWQEKKRIASPKETPIIGSEPVVSA